MLIQAKKTVIHIDVGDHTNKEDFDPYRDGNWTAGETGAHKFRRLGLSRMTVKYDH